MSEGKNSVGTDKNTLLTHSRHYLACIRVPGRENSATEDKTARPRASTDTIQPVKVPDKESSARNDRTPLVMALHILLSGSSSV